MSHGQPGNAGRVSGDVVELDGSKLATQHTHPVSEEIMEVRRAEDPAKFRRVLIERNQ